MKRREIDIQAAALQLEIRPKQLRDFLLDRALIRKTQHGYEANKPSKNMGYIVTRERQWQQPLENGELIPRWYTAVLITPAGLAWLRSILTRENYEPYRRPHDAH